MLQDVGVIAGVIAVKVAQHDGAILPALDNDKHHVMSVHLSRSAERPAPDPLLTEIADYVLGRRADGAEARRIARYCLMDTLGCGILALGFPACTKLLGPVVPGATLRERRARSRHALRARARRGRVQHRRDDPLARLQRHVARGRMGSSVGQPRRDPRGRGLSWRGAALASRWATCSRP